MSATSATAVRPSACQWVHTWNDKPIYCRDRAIPGGQLCADHLIDWAHLPAQWRLGGVR
jgi:hypothetical protein